MKKLGLEINNFVLRKIIRILEYRQAESHSHENFSTGFVMVSWLAVSLVGACNGPAQ